ncbi:MAG TPA: VOC family protein [Steroidobacteraceae bacterium]|nr:VOC family protein [Steroidobacteraceae bacterium]
MTPAGLHHLSLGVTDIERSVRFYDAALAPLGLVRVWSDLRPGEPSQGAGYGRPGGADLFALKHRPNERIATGAGFHVAFAAPSRDAVQRFHATACELGGRSDGAPGLRPAYGPHYYAAFVLDPDGHRLEAVIDRPG